MPGYAPDPDGEEFAQSRACFAELEEWLSGPEAGRLTHAETEEQPDARAGSCCGCFKTTWICGQPRRSAVPG